MATGQELAPMTKKYEDVKAWFSQPEVQKQLSMLVPAHVSADKLLRVAFQVIKENTDLLKCSMRSLISVIMGGLQLGLSFEKPLGQAYPVPFKGEAVLIIGYRGYINLARNSGEVSKVSAHPVYSKDRFEVEYGTNERLLHVPSEGDRGEFKGAYTVFFYKDGGTSFEYMNKQKIDSIRARSKADKSGFSPWSTDYDEMAVKTVIRHHAKYVPLSTERLQKAAEIEERWLDGLPQTDLLPEVSAPNEIGTGQEGPTPTPSVESTKFDGLLAEWLKKEYPKGMPGKEVDAFLAFLAKKNNVSVDVLKTDAANRWDAFVVALKKHLDSVMPKEEKKSKKEEKVAPAPTPSSPLKPSPSPPISPEQIPLLNKKQNEPTITCPNTDSPVPMSQCKVCPDAEGCPVNE